MNFEIEKWFPQKVKKNLRKKVGLYFQRNDFFIDFDAYMNIKSILTIHKNKKLESIEVGIFDI